MCLPWECWLCIRKPLSSLKKLRTGTNVDQYPTNDPAVYDMICHADTIGVFQIESRAKMAMLRDWKPRTFYDHCDWSSDCAAWAHSGRYVHPYLKRRNKEEAVEYPSKDLEEILKRTLGIPLFQEQAMKIAIVAAGFTPAEADELRRSMATFKAKEWWQSLKKINRWHVEKRLHAGICAFGYSNNWKVLKLWFSWKSRCQFCIAGICSSWIKCYYRMFLPAHCWIVCRWFLSTRTDHYRAKKHGLRWRRLISIIQIG